MEDKDDVVCDFLGNEITPGDIIAFGYRGENNAGMNIGIYLGKTPSKIKIGAVRQWGKTGYITHISGYSHLTKNLPVFLIENPLFHFDNDTILKIMEYRESLISKGKIKIQEENKDEDS